MRVLLLSYYFPPTGGAAAQRPMQLARHLVERRHELVVVTAPGPAQGRWTPADPTLVSRLPSEVEIHRVPGPEPHGATGWTSRAERWLGRRSAWADWWIDGAFRVARDVSAGAEVIYAVLSPYETAAAAGALARELGLPWVPDLGDPWVLDDMMVYPTGLHRRVALREMSRGLRSAAAIVMSTPDAVARVDEALPELAGTHVVPIANGYDRRDFDLEDTYPPRPEDGVLRIVHTGYLHTEMGRSQRRTEVLRRLLGGGSPGVDIMTRSHVYLLRAVNNIIAREPELGKRIEVHLAGVTTASDEQIALGCPAVRLRGYLPHAESVALVRSADLLFLPMQKLANGRRAGNVPGKTYEYLASGRPILAAVPPGDARDLLLRAGAAYVCEPDDVESMERILLENLRARVDGVPPPRRDTSVTVEYSWSHRADAIIDLLEKTVGSVTPRSQQTA